MSMIGVKMSLLIFSAYIDYWLAKPFREPGLPIRTSIII